MLSFFPVNFVFSFEPDLEPERDRDLECDRDLERDRDFERDRDLEWDCDIPLFGDFVSDGFDFLDRNFFERLLFPPDKTLGSGIKAVILDTEELLDRGRWT